MVPWNQTWRRFLRWFSSDAGESADAQLDDVQRRFERIARSLSRSALSMSESDVQFTISSILENRQSSLFLGVLSEDGILYSLERFGILAALAERGLDQIVAEIVPKEFSVHHLRLYCHGSVRPECLITEIVIRKEQRPASEIGVDARGLNIEWLLMQNPHAEFPLTRPPLPGQQRPGLGLGREALSLLALLGNALGLDGLWSVPEHFHNAAMYSVRYRFADPVEEGRFRAMCRDTKDLPLTEVAWAVQRKAFVEVDNGQPVRWPPGPQVFALGSKLAAFFESGDYGRARDAAFAQSRFVIDWATST